MPSQYVNQFVSGLTNPRGNVADFQHASRLFVDSDLRLAPKTKFLYHVKFNIDTNALKSTNFTYQHQNEVNMLVKAAELPKFTIQTETLNQYNRKKVVQTKIDYQPVTIRFHDDNLGAVSQLWQNYYRYYYADADAAKGVSGAYNRTAMKGSSFIRAHHGLDNNSALQFFRDITIYQMAKRAWYSYTLVNPYITSWSHDSLDSSSSQPAEQSMQVAYEAVYYNSGYVAPGNPPGFAQDHYDSVPSPLSIYGGGTKTLFGGGGVLAGAEAVFGALGSGAAFESPANFISTAIAAVNTYQNAKSLTTAGIKSELIGAATKGLIAAGNAGTSGLSNLSFPISNLSSLTNANPVNLFGNKP
jgi:hypothetical protein